MDYEGVYEDLIEMGSVAADTAVRWMVLGDQVEALKRLEFAAQCEKFRDDLFLNGYGGY